MKKMVIETRLSDVLNHFDDQMRFFFQMSLSSYSHITGHAIGGHMTGSLQTRWCSYVDRTRDLNQLGKSIKKRK